MNSKSKFVLGLFFALLVTAFSQVSFASSEISSACEWGTAAKSGQAAFFQHANYKGKCVIRLVGRYANAKAMGIGNDKISSIKLGAGTNVVLCNDNNFKGGCKTYSKSMTSIGKMNDKTSSAIIVRTVHKTETVNDASVNCRPRANQAAFFQHANYKGTCVVRNIGRYSNAKAMGIGNDKISSIKMGSSTQIRLCNDINFRGTCKTYTTSMASLGKVNDKASSAVILPKTTTTKETAASCTPKANQVAFFQHAQYKGACVVRNTGRYPNSNAIGIDNDKISSIKIGSGSNVNLCKDSNFRGTCKNYTTSMASLGKMNDQTSSAIISRTVPQKSPPYVPEEINTSPSTDASSRCDEYGICICESESECLSMGSENGPCLKNAYNEPEYACDDIGCACFQAGSSAARENPGSLCEGDGFINMNRIVNMNGFVIMNGGTPICSDGMTLSDTIIGADAGFQEGDQEEEDLQLVVSPQELPPYNYEGSEEHQTQEEPSAGAGKYELSAPSDLSVEDVTSTTLTLSWFDNADREYGVEVYRVDPVASRQQQGITWELVGLFEERIDSNVKGTGWRSEEDYDLSPGTNYCYRLRSYVGFDRSEVSDYSKLVCTKTEASN